MMMNDRNEKKNGDKISHKLSLRLESTSYCCSHLIAAISEANAMNSDTRGLIPCHFKV